MVELRAKHAPMPETTAKTAIVRPGRLPAPAARRKTGLKPAISASHARVVQKPIADFGLF